MGILETTFRDLKELELVENQYDFSVSWLNKSRSYFSMIRASGRSPSMDVLTRLAINLKIRYEMYRESQVGILRHKANLISPVATAAWKEVYERALDEASHHQA